MEELQSQHAPGLLEATVAAAIIGKIGDIHRGGICRNRCDSESRNHGARQNSVGSYCQWPFENPLLAMKNHGSRNRSPSSPHFISFEFAISHMVRMANGGQQVQLSRCRFAFYYWPFIARL